MQLSKNFSLAELTVTGTGLPNVPNAHEIAALKALVDNILQPLRDSYGKPIKVNSGFRARAVNRAIGGAKTSQHTKGEAADLDCADNAALFQFIRTRLPFDQLIWEGGTDQQPAWVHVSYCPVRARREVLKMSVVGGKKKYESFPHI